MSLSCYRVVIKSKLDSRTINDNLFKLQYLTINDDK
jgi:hypothetical protein